MNIPYLKETSNVTQLMVQDRPFTALAGEVHNSSCSSIAYFQEHVLNHALQTHVNTLLLPVYWEAIEPKEGEYDLSSVEALIVLVREAGFHIIFLWFGLWKNGLSTYLPAWMKQDRKRFPFAKKEDGTSLYSISPFSKEAIEKDASAFQQLMGKIKEVDEETQTVIMVQVENEVGLLNSNRDYGKEATDYFNQRVPKELHPSKTWSELYHEEAEDRFMAWAYAKAIETIAQGGKAIYDLPMYANAWLKKDKERAGKYPSGGPHQENIAMYQTFAPSLATCAPDIYVENMAEIVAYYETTCLCIPETRQDHRVISYGIYAFGAYPTICFAPFGIEDIWRNQGEERTEEIHTILGIHKTAFQPVGTLPMLEKLYADIQHVDALRMTWQRDQAITSFIQEKAEERRTIQTKHYEFTIYFLPRDGSDVGAGWIVEEDHHVVLYLRQCIVLISNPSLAINTLEEGTYEQGVWKKGRILNGDERYQIMAGAMPEFFRLSLFSIEDSQ